MPIVSPKEFNQTSNAQAVQSALEEIAYHEAKARELKVNLAHTLLDMRLVNSNVDGFIADMLKHLDEHP